MIKNLSPQGHWCSNSKSIENFLCHISWVLKIFKSYGFTEFAYYDGVGSPIIILTKANKIVEIELIPPNSWVYGISVNFITIETLIYAQFIFPYKEREDIKAILHYIIRNLQFGSIDSSKKYVKSTNAKNLQLDIFWLLAIFKSYGFTENDSYENLITMKAVTEKIMIETDLSSNEISVQFILNISAKSVQFKFPSEEKEDIKDILRYIICNLDFEKYSFDKRLNKKIILPNILFGAIAGDIIGSIYEYRSIKTVDFELILDYSCFTDDTILTVSVADWLLSDDSLLGIMQDYGHRYPNSYGGWFQVWLKQDIPQPYNSFGNGSAMRVSPVGWVFDTLEETLEKAKESAEVTHNHPEGIKGAQATAACIYLARTGKSKLEIKEYIESTFGYNLNRTCDEIRPNYVFDGSCQGTVPESIIAFLDSTDFESAIRLAVSLGGDADTMATITGSIAEAYYKEVPEEIKKEVLKRLPEEFIDVMERFYKKFIMKNKSID